jgi:16S rRNA (cytidine1402-2'-O)-methyltransferase
VYIALGSNVGKSVATVQAAAQRIGRIDGVTVSALSSIYRSEPAYREDQAAFCNAVLAARTTLEPLALLHELQAIEAEFGRVRTLANGPRTLDVDIIDFEGVVLATEELTLPHPLALERDFVVTPLLELAEQEQTMAGKPSSSPLLLADARLVTRDGVKYGKVSGLALQAKTSQSLQAAPPGEDTTSEASGLLSICATPIGNLGDITLRVLGALKAADIVYAEDTRVTRKLLTHFGIQTRLERCDANVIGQKAALIARQLSEGKRIAYTSDAGTPGVSDPGMQRVVAARAAGQRVEVLPGASAVLTALVASGFAATEFYFGGFLPRKKSQIAALLARLATLDAVLVFYESPHRTAKSLALFAEQFPQREVALARELTKLHEELLRGPAAEVAAQIAQREQEGRALKGEVVLLVGPPCAACVKIVPSPFDTFDTAPAEVGEVLGAEGSGFSPDKAALARAAELNATKSMTRAQIARILVKEFALSRDRAYQLAAKTVSP